jgi:hypothetical protein
VILAEAFEATAATMSLGSSVGYENATNERGRAVDLVRRAALDRLNHLRGAKARATTIPLLQSGPRQIASERR